jgi:hypothetical protein
MPGSAPRTSRSSTSSTLSAANLLRCGRIDLVRLPGAQLEMETRDRGHGRGRPTIHTGGVLASGALSYFQART